MLDTFAKQLWLVFLELSPWLLVGAIVAGIMHVVLPRDFVRRHLGGRSGVLKASLLGVPLPLCSCGVIPAGLSLHRDGASKGAAVGFLISTPQTGVDSVLVSASFLGWPFALFKLASAFVTGIVGGWLTNVIAHDRSNADPTATTLSSEPAPRVSVLSVAGVRAVIQHGVEMLRTIWGWLLFGVVTSALITTLVPPGTFGAASPGSTVLTTLAVLAVSVPLYVCATASVPIAAALVATGLPPSAALVFLMAGPATNLATMGAIYRALGRRASAVYLITIVVGSVGLGLAFDSVIPTSVVATVTHEHAAGSLAIAATFVLALLLSWFAVDDARRLIASRRKTNAAPTVTLPVSGMTCNGCARSLEAKLREVVGVRSATVSFDNGRASISGEADHDSLVAAIQAAGFRNE